MTKFEDLASPMTKFERIEELPTGMTDQIKTSDRNLAIGDHGHYRSELRTEPRASFTRMDECTAEDWLAIDAANQG
jgi:hypothetical protein